MPCNKQKYVGRDVALEYHIGCGETLPGESDWKPFGSLRTKEFNLEWDTTDATDGDSIGSLRENLATFQSLSISGDGTCRASGAGGASLVELTKHVAQPVSTGGQPVVWMRMTFPDLTFTCYMLLSSMNRSAPYDDIVTFSMEASATASDFGLIVEDTPDVNAPDPSSISVIPASLTLPVAESFNVESVVLPTGASQAVRWSSSDTAVAIVNQLSGVVTGVSVGTATITATSVADPMITQTLVATIVSQPVSLDITPDPVTVAEAGTETLVVNVLPMTAPQEVTFVSADPAVASVNSSGVITGQAAGETTVTVSSAFRPSVKKVIAVTVEEL